MDRGNAKERKSKEIKTQTTSKSAARHRIKNETFA